MIEFLCPILSHFLTSYIFLLYLLIVQFSIGSYNSDFNYIIPHVADIIPEVKRLGIIGRSHKTYIVINGDKVTEVLHLSDGRAMSYVQVVLIVRAFLCIVIMS